MNFSQFTRFAAATAVLAISTGASAQLQDVGGFGQSTVSSASNGYSHGRLMKWNGGATFNAYCIDPYTGTALPGSYDVISLNTFTSGAGSQYAQQLGRLGGYAGLDAGANAQLTVRKDIDELYRWAYSDVLSSNNTAKAAAFGLVLWEVIMQGSGNGTTTGGNGGSTYSRSSASFTTTGGDGTNGNFGATEALSTDKVEFWVDKYLTALNGNSWTTTLGFASATNWNYTIYFDNTPASQTFITATRQGVPEPATLALAAVGLFGAIRMSRRSKKV